MPLFDAHAVFLNENLLRVELPSGNEQYFERSSADPNKLNGQAPGWTAEVSQDTLRLQRGDGWQFEYTDGLITSLTTDKGHNLRWIRNPNGIQIVDNGMSLVEVAFGLPNKDGKSLTISSDAAKSATVVFGKRPNIQPLGPTNVVQELYDTPERIIYPDNRTESFKFSITPDRLPNVKLTSPSGEVKQLAWDPKTGPIASEDFWNYQVSLGTAQDFFWPKITRSGPMGTESFALYNELSVLEIGAIDGTLTKTYQFTTPGPLFQVARKIEETYGQTTGVIYQASFDEKGNTLRANYRGLSVTYGHDNNNNLTGAVSNNVELWKEQFDNAGNQLMEKVLNGPEIHWNNDTAGTPRSESVIDGKNQLDLTWDAVTGFRKRRPWLGRLQIMNITHTAIL